MNGTYLSDMSQSPCDGFFSPLLTHYEGFCRALLYGSRYPWSPLALLIFT